jgi:hypothetical protein
MVKNDVVTYYHAVNTGDLLAALPGMRQVFIETKRKARILQRLNMKAYYFEGATHPVLDDEGHQVSMNKKQWSMLTPLLKAQPYVAKCEVFGGQAYDFNLNLIRESVVTPMPNGSLYWYLPLVCPQMATDFSEPFLRVRGSFSVRIEYNDGRVEYTGSNINLLRDKLIVTRSERYLNQLVTYFFLKEFENKIVFAGTEKEHKRFCEEWNLDIPRLVVKDFLEMAQALNSCKAHLANQTALYHISEGLKIPRYLEICLPFANTWPNGKNGYAFAHQVTLEYYIRKLFSKE